MAERGWPSFMDSIDQRRDAARTASGRGTAPRECPPEPTASQPAGGPLQASQTPGSPKRVVDSAWVIAGGSAVFLGALLPFVSSDSEVTVNPGARATTALFGLIVLGLGVVVRAAQPRYLTGTSVAAVCLAALGTLGYVITIVAGMAGITKQGPFGIPVKVTFSPGIGILLALAGCVTAGIASIRSIQHHRS